MGKRIYMMTGTDGNQDNLIPEDWEFSSESSEETLTDEEKNRLCDEVIDRTLKRRQLLDEIQERGAVLGPNWDEKVVRPAGTLHYQPKKMTKVFNDKKFNKLMKKLGLSQEQIDSVLDKTFDYRNNQGFFRVTGTKNS